jgi:cyclopropane fatty-acyl-phospholipid synthase-like methyltransferase
MDSPKASIEPARQEWALYWGHFDDGLRIFEADARYYVSRLRSAIQLTRYRRLLDFGCGFGHVACELATLVPEVYVWDASEQVRHRASRRLAAFPNVRWVQLGPDDPLSTLGDLDLILVHSVVQYMSLAELRQWFVRWRDMLVPGGQLVLSDVPTPESSFVHELAALVRFSAKGGFLLRSILNAVIEVRSYRKVRRRHPLLLLSHDTIRAEADAAGFEVRFLSSNLTYRTRRISAVLTSR